MAYAATQPRRTPAPSRRDVPWHLIASAIIGAIAAGIIGYILWPDWEASTAPDPDRIPVRVGGELFNVPQAAMRVKVQRRSGDQDRIDLAFQYPSLAPPSAATIPVTAETVENTPIVIDRIFLTISAHAGTLPPAERVAQIFPRYLDAFTRQVVDGLTVQSFRTGSPYEGEDLIAEPSLAFVARCTRNAATPGMCLSDIRIDGADLTFRFPRSWLADWRGVQAAIGRLTATLHKE